MWWIISIVAVLIALILYLLFAPFFVEIDSNVGLYRFRFHRLANARLVLKDDSLYALVKVAWWQTEYDLLAPGEKKAVKKKPVRTKPAKRVSPGKIFKRIWRVIKSFRLNKCRIMIDTGNMCANGILYPWFYLLSRRTGKTILINFWNENEITLEIENNIARMAWAFLKK